MTGDPTSPEHLRLADVHALLGAGATGRAIASLRALIAEHGALASAHSLLAEALEACGDAAGAELEWRKTLAIDPGAAAAAIKIAARLMARHRPTEAVEILEPLSDSIDADIHYWTTYAMALKAAGRLDAAALAYRRAVETDPSSGVAEHNLAGVLGDAHRFAESEAATRRSFAKGLDAPETWLVRARALQGLGEFDASEAAFREAIRRRPAYAEAHGDLAQLIWMRSEDVGAACETLDSAIAAHPAEPALASAKARLLEYAGDKAGAYAALTAALARWPSDVNLLVTATLLALDQSPGLALAHAERALALAPDSGPVNSVLCQANLAIGRAEVAARVAEGLCRDWPLDQFPVALAATAWRILDDPRYRLLYDYDRLVRARTIDTPKGWSSLKDYLTDFAARLRMLQTLRAHPVGQSLRQGTQTGQSLERSDDPIVAAFFPAIEPVIRIYIDGLRGRDDILGRRAADDHRISGAWSVLLRPGGHHVDHLHPMGWISSACHIALPGTVEHDHEGWLKFGEPGLPTLPALGPEHFLKPREGDLVLFPSYMWHGTVPFSGSESRLSVAFDVVPAPRGQR